MMKITGYRFTVMREPLAAPFGFKGGAFTEKWITVTSLTNDSGISATGIGGLAVLWSDPGVFFSRSETGGNLAMALVAEQAAKMLVGTEIGEPAGAVTSLEEELTEYARKVTGLRSLRGAFVPNCLVGLDMAVWKLFARERGTEDLDDLLPGECRAVLPERHSRIARIPLVGYGMPPEKAAALAEEGCFLFKIKLGARGDQKEMLSRDKTRLSELHGALRGRESEASPGGRILYYLDANGRYESEEAVLSLLEHADAIGMLSRVVLLEEPYPEDFDIDVAGLPVRVAADESVHGPAEAAARAGMGYGAFAIKPAGKTLSVSLGTIREAAARGIPCFVADSACVPLLVEWNKCVAARLPALPGIGCGILESNGGEHYAAWDRLLSEHPLPEAPWVVPKRGYYETDESFYRVSGGVFRLWEHYERLLPALPSTAAG